MERCLQVKGRVQPHKEKQSNYLSILARWLQNIRLVLHIGQREFPHWVTGLRSHSEGIHSEVVFRRSIGEETLPSVPK
eukprot:CCRYP_000527-RA/>CCRYP_000527-RA protein AED:0.40 eAED:0.42 QI:697/0/0.5/1/0/0/2/0/77